MNKKLIIRLPFSVKAVGNEQYSPEGPVGSKTTVVNVTELEVELGAHGMRLPEVTVHIDDAVNVHPMFRDVMLEEAQDAVATLFVQSQLQVAWVPVEK